MHFYDDKFALVDKLNPAQEVYLQPYIEELMIYGGYPYLSFAYSKEIELKQIVQTSIIKDISYIYNLKNTTLVYDLLRMLAMQTPDKLLPPTRSPLFLF